MVELCRAIDRRSSYTTVLRWLDPENGRGVQTRLYDPLCAALEAELDRREQALLGELVPLHRDFVAGLIGSRTLEAAE